MQLTAAVITAATGAPELAQCVASVAAQTHPCRHYLFADGIIDYDRYWKLAAQYRSSSTDVAYWPGKIGGLGLEGRRIYAAAPSLINEDVTFFLNEDDWYAPDHVESLMSVIASGKDWAYSLRGVYDKAGRFLFNDDCESLGEFHDVWNSPGHHFVDHSSFAIRTACLIEVAQVWNYRGYGPDRVFYRVLKDRFPNFAGVAKYSLCYRLGGNPMSVSREFFEAGNADMRRRYPEGLPWLKR